MPVVNGAEQPRVKRESHVGAEFDSRIELCTEAVNLEGVQHLAQYDFGTPDFSIDVLDHVDPVSEPARTNGPRRIQDVVYLGRQLHYMMREVGEPLEKCESGRLIRAVFDVGAGALLFYEIRPGEYLVGLVLGASRVPAADAALAGVVQKIRAQLSLPDQNPGGFATAEGDTDGLVPVGAARLTAKRKRAADATDDVFLDVASAELRRGALHYAARFEESACTSFVDTLDDPGLSHYFTRISKGRRRLAYQELGGRFHTLSRSVDRALFGVVGLPTRRTVLNVEEGAVHVEHRPRGERLLGVTLVQKWVRVASDHFDNLVRRYDEAAVQG